MVISKRQFTVAVMVLILGIGLVHGLRLVRGRMQVVERNFHKLPRRIGDWKGEDRVFDDAVYDELRADENFFRIYTNSEGDTLGLYIGYYGTQRGGHPEHVPTGCYPGSGWGIESITPLDVSAGEKTITVNNLYATKGDQAEQTLYWLQNFRGTVMHNGFEQNFEKIYTKLFYNRNDGAFIRINSSVVSSREETILYQKEFIRQLLPLLPRYWPVEKVER